MLTPADVAALHDRLPTDPGLAAVLATMNARAEPVIETLPHVPRAKALLSKDGGFCPNDGATLLFNPWQPESHRCPKCGESFSGERHYLNWARGQHLWLAERMAELALIGVLTENQAATSRAIEILEIYSTLYHELPNRDNVLGPTHLFFSTYLESIWINSFLTGAYLLRGADLLSEDQVEGVNAVAEEAANLIAEFNERFSNRQTWAAAALTAVAVWFDDEDLARTAVEERTGLIGHLADGFGADGLWWEGENYHLFALRGLMQGMQWAHVMGYDILGDAEVCAHFRKALLGPAMTALPDFTYPARRDSRFGVSLAQPSSLDLWEVGRSWLDGDSELDRWLTSLYMIPGPLPVADHNDFWLHDAGRKTEPRPDRADLSWWGFMSMMSAPETSESWQGKSVLLEEQGLAVLRSDSSYASLECGAAIGGHGHPDRLHFTFHTNGNYWLPDQGTGSYVHERLAWYRSPMAHNAPILDRVNAGGADAWCQGFDEKGAWSWCRGVAGECKRTLISGSGLLVDVVDVESTEAKMVELPWHWQGEIETGSPGEWESATIDHPFVTYCERFVESDAKPFRFMVRNQGDTGELRITMLVPAAEVFRCRAPGLPSANDERSFILLRASSSRLRWITVIDHSVDTQSRVTDVIDHGALLEIVRESGTVSLQATPSGLSINQAAGKTELAGLRRQPSAPRPTRQETPGHQNEAVAVSIRQAPAIDGSLEGWDIDAPLYLDTEEQYRRSEEGYHSGRISAVAYLNTDRQSFFLAVAVTKEDLLFRPSDAPPLNLDNESDDIHSDGMQVFWEAEIGEGEIRDQQSETRGFLLIPQEGGGLYVRQLGNEITGVAVSGGWQSTGEGYLVTLRIDDPQLVRFGVDDVLRFDLLVNEMNPGRMRRAGQLVWGGDGGWIYLRGDRHDMRRAGIVRLG